MADDLLLAPEELERITGYKAKAKQLEELHAQGFWRARRARMTGAVILERAHYDAVCRGQDRPQPTGHDHTPSLRPL